MMLEGGTEARQSARSTEAPIEELSTHTAERSAPKPQPTRPLTSARASLSFALPSCTSPKPDVLAPFLSSAPCSAEAFPARPEQQAALAARSFALRASHSAAAHSSMSRRGVWQLRRLLVHYCDQGGSSRGTR